MTALPASAARARPPLGPGPAAPPVLELDHLSVTYATGAAGWGQAGAGAIPAVRDVSLAVRAGETLGIVGESGCGKSTLAYAVMGYLGEHGRITHGAIRLHGQDLTHLSPAALRRLRGARMAMVYQDPQTALNPSLVAGEQVAEAYRVHTGRSDRECWARAIDLMGRVGLPDPARLARRYPHQLSGGQQQRVVIAMALVNDPALLIMDEPTTGLDVTTEALILDLVNDLKDEFQAAILYISHSLGVIAQVCDRVAVMYAGEVAEEADAITLFQNPRHPYTVGLLGCLPRPGASKAAGRLQPIPGRLPPATERPSGCVFAPRCGLARPSCRAVAPDLYLAGRTDPADADGAASDLSDVTGRPAPNAARESAHRARCHFWMEVPDWARQRARLAFEVSGGGLFGSGLSGLSGDGHARVAEGLFGDGHARVTESATRTVWPRAPEPAPPGVLLEVRDLRRYYDGGRSVADRVLRRLAGRTPPVRAVDGISFALAPGETLALVGESGCGKTTLARTIAGLLEPTGGTVRFRGRDIACTVDQRPPWLRRDLQMVFQNPDASLNPRHTVGQIVRRPVELFLGLRGRQARQRVLELLEAVQLDPGYHDRYPGQLSGGEKQRVSIARAFAGDPRLVICDEAVSALDVSVQAAILNLLVSLQEERGTSYLFISHDLSVVRYLADRIGVMYLGKIVDAGRTEELFRPPYHPYTEALLSAIPVPDPLLRRAHTRLQGPVPRPTERPAGCPFAGRCPRYLGSICDEVPPPVRDAGNGHQITCHIPLEQLAARRPVVPLAPLPPSR